MTDAPDRAADDGPAGVDRWQIEVATRPEYPDSVAGEALLALGEAGVAVDSVRSVRVTVLEGPAGALDRAAAERLAGLLADPVTERWSFDPVTPDGFAAAPSITVRRRPGVMDPAQQSLASAIGDLGLPAGEVRVERATRYYLGGADTAAVAASGRALANDTVEEVLDGAPRLTVPELGGQADGFQRVEVAVREADDERLAAISRDGCLSLTVPEMRAIAAHYRDRGREPTDVELETLAQTWSEHCRHKTLTQPIVHRGPDGEERFGNLLKDTIMAATRELARPWCVSVFVDNAGIVEFAPGWCACFKVETHNHPSAIEPYGGAGTGIGGVIRDILGTGLGAMPVLTTDVFCLGPLDLPPDKVPTGALHPRRVLRGVVGGVRDYGNRMGIPTASGALYFDADYVGNPLVYAGCVGVLPADRCAKAPAAGDRIVVLGGRTGRDGIHGATFSSVELTEESETVSSGAVQIGNPIEEKVLLEALIAARDEGLYRAVTDCGAGGLSSAVGEMGEELGAEVDLDAVPLKYAGLTYDEIWISEAQERMVLAVPPEHLPRLLEICATEGAEATDIGRFTGDERLTLRYRGEVVADMEMSFLHGGLPETERPAQWTPPELPDPDLPPHLHLGDTLLAVLASPNVASKAFVIRQYDHEVQGTSVLKPLVGIQGRGPGDAAVIRPLPDIDRGLAVGCGCNPRLGRLNPYRMAAWAIDEAIRNVVAVGADPSQVSILDNFSWGNTADPEQLGALVEAAKACRDVSLAYGAPFISGKDSLNNEFLADGERHVIPPTLLISAMGVVADLDTLTTSDLQEPGNSLWLVGETDSALGGSHLHLVLGLEGGEVPAIDLERAPRLHQGVHRIHRAGVVRSCHDLSEGGLAVALAEMVIGGDLGASISVRDVPRAESDPDLSDAELLFAESAPRWLVEVRPGRDEEKLAAILESVPAARIGSVIESPMLVVGGLETGLLRMDIDALVEAFSALDRQFGHESA